MIKKKPVLVLLLISFALSVGLGMLDKETESLIHLFTAELGNLVALVLYTGVFFLIGLAFMAVARLLSDK